MSTSEILHTVSSKLPDPAEVIYAFRMQDLVAAIVCRMGENALTLTSSDILLARNEVSATIEHYMNEREFLEITLDTCEIIRNCK